uniref:Peptidase S1 domain-containing protein n=2 Tax=Magallana gigas TaxID=29159 RepID=A0A8W8NZW6_MAGGI
MLLCYGLLFADVEVRVASAPAYHKKNNHHDVGQHMHRPKARTYSAPPNHGCSHKLKSMDCNSSCDLNKGKRENDIKQNLLQGTFTRRVGTVSQPKIQLFYYKANSFQHFDYIYKLTRDCKLRNFRGIHCNCIETTPMPKDVILEIGIVGDFTEENLRFITKSKDENKEENIRAITSCLEKPIHQMLQNWSAYLETKGLGKHTSRVIAEIKAIGKQLELEESKGTAAVFEMKCQSIVPGDMKDYLFGSSDVNAFGIWGNFSFKIFVKKTTDQTELKNELIKRYRHFFDIYPLDVEVGNFIEHRTLKQGDPIFANNACEKPPTGTLGGFVMKVNEERKKYALTCNHIFPSRNQIAYADGSDDGRRKQIGSCVFSRSDMSCDFAAIEMNDTILNECDVIFRRDDGKNINAHIYDETLEKIGFVYKIGATTDVTQGYILSSEFYNKHTAEGNRECIFLVKGTDGNFSEEGDSGSLVFSRPRNIQQNYVDIVGMVYAKNRKAKDDDEVEIYNRTDTESEILHSNQNISTEVKNAHENIQQTPLLSRENDGQRVAENDQNAEDFSFCYRLNTALALFKQDQGPGFDVRFKDDLSSSSSATSLSSGSDVEAV